MSLFVNTKYRSHDAELMDDFSLQGEALRDTLNKLGTINKWLGGNKVTIDGVFELLKDQPKDKTHTILDLGCGHGDLLRRIAKVGKEKGFQLQLIGIDANADAIDYAKSLSGNFKNISYHIVDVFSEEFKNLNFDIALSTLFLHHLNDSQVISMLNHLNKKAKIGVVINDLHRHQLAYFLFKFLGLFIKNEMIVEDGLTSILRGFKKAEIKEFSSQLKLNDQLKWCWAFRWQWILRNRNRN